MFNSIICIIFEQYKNLRIWIDTQRKTIQKSNYTNNNNNNNNNNKNKQQQQQQQK